MLRSVPSSVLRPGPYDREIIGLAIPALGALAAEPLYVLADTAIVGHLGTRELAALALAATVLSALVALCNFLAYGTTAQVARLAGAGETERAAAMAAQALWLALGVGIAVALLVLLLAGPVVDVVGGGGEASDLAARYLRLGCAGIPCALVALAGQGYLRGVGSLWVALVIVAIANAVNVVLEVVLVYGFDLGLDGSAVGTVVAQLGMALAFAVLLLRAGAAAGVSRRPRADALRSLGGMAAPLLVRTGALLAAFTLASAVLARDSDAALAAHQIAFQLFVFLALVLDALAIAGQVIVGRLLGAGDVERALGAARRMIAMSVVVGIAFGLLLLAGTALIPRAFTSSDAVLDRARELWPLFALLQVPGAAVFALDGILIGAGDTRYIAGAMTVAFLVFAPLALLAGAQGWGVVGIWVAIDVLMLVRLATMWHRFAGGRWIVLGA